MEGRLRNEIRQLQAAENDAFVIVTDADGHDNLFSHQVVLRGPRQSPYSDGVFSIKISIPSNYPFQPPEVAFETMIWHPYVNFENGNVSLSSVIGEDWSPSWTLRQLLNEVLSVLRNPNLDRPAANPVAADLFRRDRHCFDLTAMYWTKFYTEMTSEAGGSDDMSQQLTLQMMLDQSQQLDYVEYRQNWEEVMAIELPSYAFIQCNDNDTESQGSANTDCWSMGGDDGSVISFDR